MAILELIVGAACVSQIVKNVGVDKLKKHAADIKDQVVTSVKAGISDANAGKEAATKTQVMGDMFKSALENASPEDKAELLRILAGAAKT